MRLDVGQTAQPCPARRLAQCLLEPARAPVKRSLRLGANSQRRYEVYPQPRSVPRVSAMSRAAAQAAMSPRFSAVAVRSGNWSGVQANTGQPSAASLPGMSWRRSRAAGVADSASSTIRLTPLATSASAPRQHLGGVAALEEIADQHQMRPRRPLDPASRNRPAPR